MSVTHTHAHTHTPGRDVDVSALDVLVSRPESDDGGLSHAE